jgi:Asp-tRNA(Asn)/Glu-tRNA(Gln) amidotransferase A subunit family amidase
MYAVLAGPDQHDFVSQAQPAPTLADYESSDLSGVRLGINQAWFEDASPDVVARCRDAVKVLTDAGAKVVEIPAPDLNIVLWTHSVLILSEMSEAMRAQIEADVTQFGLDSRTNLAIGQHFRATDYVHALRHRHAMTRDWLKIMQSCDAVVTPTCATTAPAIPEASLPDGESNLPVVDALMRFVRVANITGFPAISVNAGFDRGGLPVGVQLMARPYEEHLLLRLARVIEAHTETRTPAVHASAFK